MAHVTYSQVRSKLAAYMDQVCDDRAPLLVTRRNERSVVLMSSPRGSTGTTAFRHFRARRHGCKRGEVP
jgi:prevent-host-death family protein